MIRIGRESQCLPYAGFFQFEIKGGQLLKYKIIHSPTVSASHPPTILTASHSHPLFISPSYSLDITGIDRATVLH